MPNFGEYFELSPKFSQPCLPSKDNIFLYPTNLEALAKVVSSNIFWTEKEADAWVKNAKLTPFGRFGLVKILKTRERNVWSVDVRHNILSVVCAEALAHSLVWSLKHRNVAIGQTLSYWKEFIDYANAMDELDAQCMELLKKISVIEHPGLAQIVNEAIMIRMLKPVAVPRKHW